MYIYFLATAILFSWLKQCATCFWIGLNGYTLKISGYGIHICACALTSSFVANNSTTQYIITVILHMYSYVLSYLSCTGYCQWLTIISFIVVYFVVVSCMTFC